MVLKKQKVNYLFQKLVIAAVIICFFVLLLKGYLYGLIKPFLKPLSREYFEVAAYFFGYFFIGCSTILFIIDLLIERDHKNVKSDAVGYKSELVAKDYYKATKKIDYYKAVQTMLSKHTNGPQQIEEKSKDQPKDTQLNVDEAIGKAQSYTDRPPAPKDLANQDVDDHVLQDALDGLDDTSDGAHQKFFKNGNIEKEYTYKNGKLEGLFKTFYEDGQFHQEKYYKNGKLDGVFRAYDTNGILYFEISYKDDKKHGVENSYDQNGVLQHQDVYEEGKRISRKVFNKKEGEASQENPMTG